jgi:hypothetical protein
MPITAPARIKITPATQVEGKNRVTPFSPKSRSGSKPEKDSGNGNNNNNINGGGGGGDDDGKKDRCQSRYNNEFSKVNILQVSANNDIDRAKINNALGSNLGSNSAKVYKNAARNKITDSIENLEMLLLDCGKQPFLDASQIQVIKDKIEELRGQIPKKIQSSKTSYPTRLNIPRPIVSVSKTQQPGIKQFENFIGNAAAWGATGLVLESSTLT